LVLHQTIIKAISFVTFFALTLGPGQVPPPSQGTIGGLPSQPAAPPTAAPPALGDDADHDPHRPQKAKPSLEKPEKERPSSAQACPAHMILVEGEHCPDAEQTCLKWLDPPPYQNLRCGEYARPAKCKGPKVVRRFCIDREEYGESHAASSLPVVKKSWTEAQSLCGARGARLCRESEWEFACEGPEMSPYPYGWKRESSTCNLDRTDLGGPNEKLNDHRAPASAFPACKSPFGVHNMVGNVDEWVEREGASAPNRSALRGGWWLPGRNRCRAATLHHDESYQAKQVGFRCCKDAP
jgi:formylglycine-generating enzyme